MPSPGEDIQSWSTVAGNNGNSDPLIDWHEGQTRASVNNSSRSEMAAIAKNRNLLNGSIVTTGTKNAQQFLSGVGYTGTLPTAIPTGLRIKLKIGSGLTNDATATMNMDGLGDVLIKDDQDNNLKGGELVADGYADLLYNGTNWIFLYSRSFFFDLMTGGGGLVLGIQKFATAGTFTYTPNPEMEACIIECIGGGGGGGGCYGDANQVNIGSGGGSGGYSRKLATPADIGASQVVIVGSGGTAGGPSGAPAGSGGVTSVGTLCVANGGGPGLYYSLGGGGAAVGVGDIAAAGAVGRAGASTPFQASVQLGAWGASGAPGPFGGGGNAGQANFGQVALGQAGTAYGSGGGGGNSNLSSFGTSGGAGSAGLVIITEFAGRGAPGRDGEDGAQGPIGPPGPAGSGTGDVLVAGTPTAGQLAQWFDTSHIMGIDATTFVAFPAGTLMLFQQTAAPTGWTKQTTHDNKALRVVSGTASSGGTVAFSTVFGRTATDGTTLTIATMPYHTHPTDVPLLGTYSGTWMNNGGTDGYTATIYPQGGSGAHTHPIDLRVQYVDLIIASKNA